MEVVRELISPLHRYFGKRNVRPHNTKISTVSRGIGRKLPGLEKPLRFTPAVRTVGRHQAA